MTRSAGKAATAHLLGAAVAGVATPVAAGFTLDGVGRAIAAPALVPVDDLLATGAAAALTLIVARLALVHLLTGLCLLASRAGRVARTGLAVLRVLAPRLARRVAMVSAGAGLAAGALSGTAVAEAPPGPQVPAGPPMMPTAEVFADEDSLPPLGWSGTSPVPTETTAGTPAGPPEPPEPPAARPAQGTVTVRPGDTLWSIAADTVSDDSPGTIAAVWPQIYEANRDVLTDDPDLIHPGAELRIPRDITTEESR